LLPAAFVNAADEVILAIKSVVPTDIFLPFHFRLLTFI